MCKKFCRILVIIFCVTNLFSATSIRSYAAKQEKKHDDKHTVKRVLVKYRKDNANRENQLNNKINKNKFKKFKRLNNKNMYIIEAEDIELDELLKDSEIELVEEDSIVQLLCDNHPTDSLCTDINYDTESFSLDDEMSDNILIETSSTDINSSEDICVLCGWPAFNDNEECMDSTHSLCNDCIRKMTEELQLEEMAMNQDNELSCSCGCENVECICHELCEVEDCHELCETGMCSSDCTCVCPVNMDSEEDFWKDYTPCCEICSIECTTNPCCEQCIYGDIYYQRYEKFKNEAINETKELELGDHYIYSSLGDRINWNILRTKSNILHDKNIKGAGIKIAVFDTGIDLNHKELNVKGGVSFVEGTSSFDDDNGHGTAMAGIFAAQLNGQGIVGIAPDVDLYSVKVLDKNGEGRYSSIIQGIEWAIENEINIISLSLGSNQYSQILEEAINLAVENSILIVAAAGNGGKDNIMYPAAYPQVICVGATDNNNNLATFSNYGFQLDIVAPGASVVTTGLNNTEVTVDGTSPAAGHVAGIAALLWSADDNLSNGHIKYLLYKNAYDLGEYNLYGHGLADAELSLRNLENKDYSVFIDDMGEGTYVDGLVDAGWDGVVYGQACSHNFVQFSYTAPTCFKEGYLVQGCNKCGFVSYAGSLPRLSHSNKTTTKSATCTSDGYTETKCTRCGYISGRTTITKYGHNFVYQYTTAPKCTTDGKANFKCSRCSLTKYNLIPKVGHSINTKTTPATCTSGGKTVDTCNRGGCSYSYTYNVTSQLGHSTTTTTTPATCTSDGKKVVRCTRSGCNYTSTTIIPYTGHNYQTSTTNSGCTTWGRYLVICSRCGHVSSDEDIPPKGHKWVYDSTKYPTCQSVGYDYYHCSVCQSSESREKSKLSHSYNNYSISSTHSSNGHYWTYTCSNGCGAVGSSGYKTLSNCLSCTTAPSISFSNISGSTVLSEADTNFKPQIKVFDNENDTLTCKYHLDDSSTAVGTMTVTGTKPEKTVNFTTGFNAASLSEGNHTIKATAKDPVAPMGETIITFKVDKSPPTISSHVITPSTKDVKITVTASDSISGLASTAYRYTINGVASGWLSASTYTKTGLVPNTAYSYVVEVRDAKGHIATKSGTFTTKVEKPVVTVTALNENYLQIVVSDNNPASTQYRVKVGSGYVNTNGIMVSSESWITIPYDGNVNGKKLTLSNLSSNTSYLVTVSARDIEGTEITTGTTVSAITSPAAPVNIATASISHEQISLQWQAVTGALQYEIYRETLNEQRNTIDKLNRKVYSNYIYDNSVLPNQTYKYKIRSINQTGIYGLWSSNVIVKSLPTPPEKVQETVVNPDGSSLKISWNKIDGAVGYEIEIDFNGSTESLYSKENQITFDTRAYNCQSTVRIKAYNMSEEDDPNNHTYWTNAGEWCDTIISYTQADIPTIQSINKEQITPKSIKVSWDVSDNPESVTYVLKILQDSLSIREIPVTGERVANNIITYQVTGLWPETAYTFSVKAINSIGDDTEWSEQVLATTLMDYPGVPQRLRASAKSNSIILNWDAPAHAQGYQIEKNGQIIENNWLITNYVDSDLDPDTTYDYRVKAINTTGESVWSQNLIKKTLGNVPSAPMVNIVTGSAISISIEWTTSEDVSGYELDADGHIYNMGMSTEFEHNGLTPGTVHTYAVRSRNIYGKSEWSDYITFRTTPLIPDIPTITQVIPTESNITVYWKHVSGTQYYEVEIDDTIVGITSSLGYQYEFIDGNSDIEHTIRLRAVNESGSGIWSMPYTISLLKEGEVGIPLAPIPTTPNIACSVTGSAIVVIDWESVQDATYYQLEADNGIIYTGGESRYIHAGLLPGSQHQYRIRAGNLSGESQWSEIVTVYVESSSLTTPRNISYYRIDDDTTKLIWDYLGDISEYAIEVNGDVLESTTTEESATIHTEPGSLYNIRIATIKVEDEIEVYDWSEEITFRTSRRLPKVPDNISSVASADTITMSWEAGLDAQGYELDTPIGIIDVGDYISYMISGLEAAETYKLKVRAYNEAGYGDWSQEINIMTKDEIPGVPINIRYSSYQSADIVTGSAISLQWESVEGASSYEVEDMDGRKYITDTNDIIIGGLMAGHTYKLRVRAITGDALGAWSSRISVTPVVATPNNSTAVIEGDIIKVSWDPVSTGDVYEIEIDGVIVATTNNLFYEFDYQTFYMQRMIRIRALRDGKPSDWSTAIEFTDSFPTTVNTYMGEEFSVIFPARNVEISNYKLTLSYDKDEVELVDACEMTSAVELTSSYIEEFDIYIIIERDGRTESITYICDDNRGLSYTGIVNSLKLRSKVTGEITLHYVVTLR